MQYTNHYNLPTSLVDAIINEDYDLTKADPKRIGITTLINPPRQRLLAVHHWKELEEDVSEHLWRLTGSAVHWVVSQIANKEEKSKHRLIEKKFEITVDGITIVGKLDNYDMITKSIEDFKITSVWSVKMGSKIEWERQLNCYVWLLRQYGHSVESLYINAILKDWRKNEIFKFNDYPKIPFMRINVRLWSNKEQDEYVQYRVNEYNKQLALPIEQVPICSSQERWQKKDVYACMKGSNKTSSRNLATEEEANQWIANQIKPIEGKKTKIVEYKVVKRPGLDLKCSEYCNVNSFCSYYKEHYAGKENEVDTEE